MFCKKTDKYDAVYWHHRNISHFRLFRDFGKEKSYVGKIFSIFFHTQLFRARIMGAFVIFFGLSTIVLFGWCNGIIKLVHSLLAAKKLDESIY
jgi:hypothetical protein